MGRLRAGTHEGHRPVQHVEQLRQLVEGVLAQEPADRCDPRIAAVLCEGEVVAVGVEAEPVSVRNHRPELVDAERLPIGAEPLLGEQRVLPVAGPDGERDRHQHRRDEQKPYAGGNPVEAALDHARRTRQPRVRHREHGQMRGGPDGHPRAADLGEARAHDEFRVQAFEAPRQAPQLLAREPGAREHRDDVGAGVPDCDLHVAQVAEGRDREIEGVGTPATRETDPDDVKTVRAVRLQPGDRAPDRRR